jgi:WD40 repeat protein
MGGGTFQYTPDNNSLAYIDFEPDAGASEFADGFLRVRNTADMSEMFSFESVTAFDITNEGMGFVSFFTNDRSEADEAAVFWWNGSAEREVATLRPDENCRYTSASVAVTPDGNLLIIMGHRCLSGDTRTSWQLYRVDVAARSATLAATEFAPGQFASYSRTNQITVLPNNNAVMFTVPDGVTANTVALMTVNLDDLSTSTIIERQAVFPTLNQGSNVFPLVSPDGRWLALVVTSLNNDNTLHVYDLQDLSVAPITISAGSRNDIIADMAFSADSNWLIFIAGSESTGRDADNSLIALDLNAGSDFRIKRGRFARGLAVSSDGGQVVVQDAEVLEDERQPTFLNLVQVAVNTSETALLFEGADVVDGEVTNQRFAKPLIWR